jgi:hypothetical protein
MYYTYSSLTRYVFGTIPCYCQSVEYIIGDAFYEYITFKKLDFITIKVWFGRISWATIVPLLNRGGGGRSNNILRVECTNS